MYHKPVMCKEVLENLNLKEGMTILDATVGTAGHAELILEKISPSGKLIGIDRDLESLEIAKERLARFKDRFIPFYGDFRKMDTFLERLNIAAVDGMLFDLGVSSYQLQTPYRGFSFQTEGPLDMRMDRQSYISAYDLVNNLTEKEISGLLSTFGQERWHRHIAHLLVEERKKSPISTTTQLSSLILKAIPYKKKYKIHPATRTFLAFRIAVNRELEALEEVLAKFIDFLKIGGRICIISFHSLEDRLVKEHFRILNREKRLKILYKKPLRPTVEEIKINPRSRSAKLRIGERIK